MIKLASALVRFEIVQKCPGKTTWALLGERVSSKSIFLNTELLNKTVLGPKFVASLTI